jgi:hypothetical protein
MFRVDRLSTHPLSEGRLPLAAESKTIFLRLELLYGIRGGCLRVEKCWWWSGWSWSGWCWCWCWTRLLLYQPDGPQPPERTSSKAAERADLGSRDGNKANDNDNDNYNCSETHIRAQYPPHFTPARAGRPGWQLLDVRLSLRL